MLHKLKIFLLLFVSVPMAAWADGPTQSTLANTWSDYSDLYSKSKSLYSSIKEDGGSEVKTFKESLGKLNSALENASFNKDSLQALCESVQSQAKALSDNDDVKDLKSNLESFRNSASQAVERIKDIWANGMVYSMPATFESPKGSFNIKCVLDSLRYIHNGIDFL